MVATPESLRHEADRARFYALMMRDELTVERLREYATELDAKAAELEEHGPSRACGIHQIGLRATGCR